MHGSRMYNSPSCVTDSEHNNQNKLAQKYLASQFSAK